MRFRIVTGAVLFFYSVVSAQPVDGVNYLAILRRAATYGNQVNYSLPGFTYQSSNTPELVALRKKFKLDSVAGFGNEASRLINLLHWVHNTVKHDGQHESGIKKINAMAIVTAVNERHIGVSCGELATTLNDCYLAMGWKSRKIYCFPMDSLHNDHDSHVINVVFLSSQNKWIWMDPTNDAYIMDEKGSLLGIEEVRQRLIEGKPLLVNPDANWNHRSSTEKSYYLDVYMAKNLYLFYSPLRSAYNYETPDQDQTITYVCLFPVDYKMKLPSKTVSYNKDRKLTIIRYNLENEKQFCKSPED